jgi:hypothetical protein
VYQHLLLNSAPISLAAAFLIGCGAWRLGGTTLVPPALWALGAVVAVGCVEVLAAAGLIDADPASPMRYAAAVTTLCPMIAVLGAKRPQDRAWKWVVVALLATLWLPAANAWIVSPGEPVHLSLAWRFFIVVLWLLGPLNYLPTGNWLPALVAAAGQGVLLAPFLGPSNWNVGRATVPVAVAAFLAATGLVWICTSRPAVRQLSEGSGLHELNVMWRRFRDAFGAFWAVRVMQRVNQGVASIDPPVALKWHGWEGLPGDNDDLNWPTDAIVRQAAVVMRTTLRRFVQSTR